MDAEKVRTVVVFRVSKDDPSDVYALMPFIEGAPGMCTCYQHVGQHSSANYFACVSRSRPAQFSEYRDLYRELCSIGYVPLVRKRRPRLDPCR